MVLPNRTIIPSLQDNMNTTGGVHGTDTVTSTSPCVSDSTSGCTVSPQWNKWEDPVFIVAVLCFALGGLLFLIGFIRLLWYLSQPKQNSRSHFPYVIRYTDPYYIGYGEQRLYGSNQNDADNESFSYPHDSMPRS